MNVVKEECVLFVPFAMFSFNIKNCLMLLLLMKVSSTETRPAPFLGNLINGLLGGGLGGGGGGLLGGPPMYPTNYGPPPAYSPPGPPPPYSPPGYGYGPPPAYSQYPPMLDLKNPVPSYPNQPMPALFAQTPQQPNPNQGPNAYPWPQLTMTPPSPYPFYPTTGVPGALANLGAGFANFAQAQGGAFTRPLHSIIMAIKNIFSDLFSPFASYPPGPWVPM